MNQAPALLSIAFLLVVFVTVYFLYLASNKSKLVLIVSGIWLIVQSAISLAGFYLKTNSIPPRFLLLVMPPMVLLLVLFFRKKGREIIFSFNLKRLTLLHVVRLPIELILFWLCVIKWVPELMTFEGRNLDILSGITAIPIVLIAFRRNHISKNILLIWNFLALLLVINVMVHGMLSSPSPLQQFAFDQPNIAVLHFPFNLLTSFIVPVVIFSHITSLIILLRSK